MKPLKSAWPLTWDSIGSHKSPPPGGNRILAILNYRRSPERVREFVEDLYVTLAGGLSDKVAIATDRQANLYPTMLGNVGGVRVIDQMHCGHNPWINARRVRNVRLERVDGEERLAWDEVPPPQLPDFLKRPSTDA